MTPRKTDAPRRARMKARVRASETPKPAAESQDDALSRPKDLADRLEAFRVAPKSTP